MKKILLSLAFIAALFSGSFVLVMAGTNCSTAFKTASGGTGWCAFTSGAVLFGNGTGAIATSTNFTFSSAANRLTVTNASTTFITATTASTTNLTVSSAGGAAGCATFSVNGTISNTGSACGGGGGGSGNVSTSSAETATQIPIWTSTAGTPALLSGGVAGFTFTSAANRLTVTYATTTGISTGYASTTNLVVSSAGGVAGCATFSANGTISNTNTACGTGNGTVTSITLGGGLDGLSPITTTGTIIAQVGTSSVPTVGQFAQWTGNGTPSTLGSVASSTFFTGNIGQVAWFQSSGGLIGTSSIFIQSTTGNVMIGTTTPISNSLLTIGAGNPAATTTVFINGGAAGTGAGALLLFGQSATNKVTAVTGGIGNSSTYFNSTFDANLGVMSQAAISFFTNATNLVRGIFTTTGELGIGTSTPFAEVSIHQFANDTARTTLFAIASSTASATTTVFSVTRGGQAATCETVYGKTANGADYASSTSMTIDFQAVCNQVLLQVGSAAFTVTVTNAKPADTKRIIIQNPAAAAGAITWAGVKWFGGTAPTQTTTANTGDMYSCITTQASSTAATTVKVECGQTTGTQ